MEKKSLAGVAGGDKRIYVVYKSRWVAIGLFGLGSLINAAIWISFSPIASISADYYGVSTAAINMLSVIYMILFVPGTFLASWLFSRLGLRGTMLASNGINFLGSVLRYASTKNNTSANPGGYALLLIGQALCGLVQPVYVNASAKIAATWFSIDGRDLATTLAALTNPVGTGLGQLIPSILVSENKGMPTMLLTQFLFSGVTLALIVFFFNDRPPTPPSFTQTQREDREDAERSTPCGMDDLKTLAGNKHFLLLCIGFGFGLAYFNTLVTVLGQQIQPLGYTTDDAGVFGFLILGCGILGCAVFGPVMDATHRYKTILKSLGAVGVSTVIGLCFALRPNNRFFLGLVFAIQGFFVLPLLPTAFECMVECTYPIPEEVTNGIMLSVGNVLSIGATFLWQDLIKQNGDGYHGTFVHYNLLQVVMIGLAAGFLLPFNGNYDRLEAESQGKDGSLQVEYVVESDDEGEQWIA